MRADSVSDANIFTAISGWISGIATVAVGVIALIQNRIYFKTEVKRLSIELAKKDGAKLALKKISLTRAISSKDKADIVLTSKVNNTVFAENTYLLRFVFEKNNDYAIKKICIKRLTLRFKENDSEDTYYFLAKNVEIDVDYRLIMNNNKAVAFLLKLNLLEPHIVLLIKKKLWTWRI